MRENPAATLSLTAAADAYEGGAAEVMTLTREGDLEDALAVTVAASGTATGGTDFMVPFTILLAPYQVTANVQVFPLDDSAQEGDESITYTLQSGTGYAVGTPDAATITLYDNDTPSTVTITGMANVEEGSSPGLFRVNRAGALHQQITVWFMASGTAMLNDYQAPMSVTFAPWSTEEYLIVTDIDDAAVEGTETITYTVMPMGTGYVAGAPNSGTIDLIDNDHPAGVSVHALEDAIEGSANGRFRVVRTGDLTTSFQLNYSVAGTATSGSDYASLTPVWFAPDQSTADLTVIASDDGLPEPIENVSLTVQPGPGYVVGGNPFAAVNIVNPFAPPPGGQGTGLYARYYNTRDLSGQTVGRVDQSSINFDWGRGAPANAGVGVDNFSVRWTGLVQAQLTDNYTFSTFSDDGVRLWVNGVLVINNWTPHSPTNNDSNPIALVAGQKYEIKLEYFEQTLDAIARLSWTPASTGAKVVIPQSQLYPVQFDLDVNKNGSLGDAVDGADTYLPGYSGNVQVLTTTNEQEMNLIATGLTPNTAYNVRLTNTTKYAGIASNADSVSAIYPSSGTDNDYVLVVQGSDPDELVTTDDTDTSATTSATGVLTIKIRARDFGGATTVKIRDANGVNVASLSLPRDGDNDGLQIPGGPAALPVGDKLADVWEDLYATVPAGFANFIGYDKTKVYSVNGIADGARDDDRNEGGKNGKNVGDRLPAFDEYRGFLVSGAHKRTAPTIKQIFVYSPDNDPYTAVVANYDGLNTDRQLGLPMGVGAYASDLDAEIILINAGEFDSQVATLGDVNYRSPAPYGGIKQKYVWVVSDTNINFSIMGSWPGSTGAPARGPNEVFGLGQADPGGGPQIANTHPHFGKQAAIVHLGAIRASVSLIDSDGHDSDFGGGLPAGLLIERGPPPQPPHARRDPNRLAVIGGNDKSMYYFTAADKVLWNDRNSDGHWDGGDELWIDVDADGKFSAGDKVIFDYDVNLMFGTNGIAVTDQTEFRYVRRDNQDAVANYSNRDYIFTTYFNSAYYIKVRDLVIAHEAVGHPTELPHDGDQTNYSIMYAEDPQGVGYSANGLRVRTATNTDTYINPPTTFSDADQDTKLQLRE